MNSGGGFSLPPSQYSPIDRPGPSREECERRDVARPHRPEVPVVERHNEWRSQLLCQGRDRGINSPEREVPVYPDQFGHAGETGLRWLNELQ